MYMENQPVILLSRITPETFRAFALFDAFQRQKRWRGPALFALIFSAFAAVCFTLGRDLPQSGLLGGVLLAVGLVPKLSALLTTIPQAVIGGATISVFATITMTGIRMITSDRFTMRSSAVVGLSVALGVGITQVAGSLQGPGFPAWVHTVFGSSPIVVTAIVAILLNLLLPKEPPAQSSN